MNDKRDEVIEAAKVFLLDADRNQTSIFQDMADFAIKHALSRETELRRQIADEIAEMIRVAGNDVHSSTLNAYIEKLRGNK